MILISVFETCINCVRGLGWSFFGWRFNTVMSVVHVAIYLSQPAKTMQTQEEKKLPSCSVFAREESLKSAVLLASKSQTMSVNWSVSLLINVGLHSEFYESSTHITYNLNTQLLCNMASEKLVPLWRIFPTQPFFMQNSVETLECSHPVYCTVPSWHTHVPPWPYVPYDSNLYLLHFNLICHTLILFAHRWWVRYRHSVLCPLSCVLYEPYEA